MSRFLYFVPGIAEAHIPRAKVATTFAATAFHDLLRSEKTWASGDVVFNQLVMGGPGGHVGTIFAHVPVGSEFVADYHPGKQTWVPIGNEWLEWLTDDKPTEKSLRRDQIVRGYAVDLNDDCSWIAPTIRCQPAGSRVTLPQALGLGEDGKLVARVKPQYQRYKDLAEKAWNHKIHGGLNNGELWALAADLLSLNYRVGQHEVAALSLFELIDPASDVSPNWYQIIDASYDWPVVEEVLGEAESKKK